MKTLLIIAASAIIISLLSLTCISGSDWRKFLKEETGSKQEANKLQAEKNTIYPDLMIYTVTAL